MSFEEGCGEGEGKEKEPTLETEVGIYRVTQTTHAQLRIGYGWFFS